MKKVVKSVILLFFIFLLFQLIVFIFKKEHDVSYDLSFNDMNYKIHEVFKNKRYNFEVKVDDSYFVFDTDNNYHKKKKVIDKLYYYEDDDTKCIYAPLEDSDIVCLENGVLKFSYASSSNSFIKELKKLGYSNPNWDSNEDPDEAFAKAVEFAEVVFDNTLASTIAKAKAEQIVEEAIEKAEEHIMVLNQFVPWQEYIFSSTSPKADEIQFVVFPSNRGGYNWQCVPDGIGSFGQRKSVPEEWKGLRDADIQKVTGIDTATFCHPAGFIGGAETFADAYALAKKAVEA